MLRLLVRSSGIADLLIAPATGSTCDALLRVSSPGAAFFTRESGPSPDCDDRPRRGVAHFSSSAEVPDLATANAPTKVLELIGDPRSGVADDVTNNPFGGVTVDMVHHSVSKEGSVLE